MSYLRIPELHQSFNIYCDESCHLQNDESNSMVIGALWCPTDKAREIAGRIREIKFSHGKKPSFEVKWTKVSKGGQELYVDLINYFFDNQDLHFRAWIATDKNKLQHELFGHDHDTWYYKMYYYLLRAILLPNSTHFVYIDIKDTRSNEKVRTLQEVLCRHTHDSAQKIIPRVQQVRSHEVEHVQLADLLIGAISYVVRGLDGQGTNQGKEAIIQRIRSRSKQNLLQSTLLTEPKFNLFHWKPSEWIF